MTVTSPLHKRNRNALRNDFRYAPVPYPSYNNPSFLPTPTRDRADRPLLHIANADRTGSLCGAPVIGVLVYNRPVECVVCADIREGRKRNNLDNTKPRKRRLRDRLRRR